MGVDVRIYFKTKSGDDPELYWGLSDSASITRATEYGVEGSTHEVDTPWRYYGPGYERGPWPKIASVLINLLANKDIETVWYFGDCYDEGDPFTLEMLEQYTRHFIEHENRPYRDAFKKLGKE